MIIDNINNTTNQNIEFILSDNSIVYIDLHYKDNLRQWTFDIKYNDFVLNNQLLTCSKNVLDQFSNILPFGLEVRCKEDIQPFFQNCFVNGMVQLIINEYEKV